VAIYRSPIEGLRVGAYLRRSMLAQEDSLGLQDEDTGDYAAEHGATVVKQYPEDGKSAWKRKRVVLPSGAVGYRVIRPRFAELLEDLRTGAVEGAVVYDLDRLTRDLRDLKDAIEVVEAYGRPIVGPGVDLTTDAGRANARAQAVAALRAGRPSGRGAGDLAEAAAALPALVYTGRRPAAPGDPAAVLLFGAPPPRLRGRAPRARMGARRPARGHRAGTACVGHRSIEDQSGSLRDTHLLLSGLGGIPARLGLG
jgi:hypothetical protein